MLKGLNQWRAFKTNEFIAKMALTVSSVSPWIDFDTKKVMGTKVEVFISKDGNKYETKDGSKISNLGQTLVFKVPHDVAVNIEDIVVPVNPVATVYGEYNNQLSIKVDDVVLAPPTTTVPSSVNGSGSKNT